MNYIKKTFKYVREMDVRVEPLIFLLAFANTAKSIVTPALSEDKMRRVYPAPPGLHDKELKKFYNKKMVLWDQNYEYVNLPIACIVGIIYGGFSDHHGRKIPLLTGILSCLVETAIRILVWSQETDIALQWLFGSAVAAGLLGDFLLTMSCINAYVTDQFDDKHRLSIRMVAVSIIFSLGSFCGSQASDALLNVVSHIELLYIVEGLFGLSFIAGLLILEQKIPHKPLIEEDEEGRLAEWLEKSAKQIVFESFYSIYDAAKIFVKPRSGHRRAFLLLCFLANFLDQFVFGEEKSLIGTYTRLSPFNWSTHDYATYKSWRPIVQIVGMFLSVLILKKLMKLKDTFIICMAIASMGACVIAIGLAQASWIIYLSLPMGSLHGMLNPLTYAFMSCLIELDEVGKAFAIASIAQKLAGIAQTAILQNIYTATVDWYQGFVWLLMGGVSFIAVGIYAFVHIVATREGIQIPRSTSSTTTSA